MEEGFLLNEDKVGDSQNSKNEVIVTLFD